MLTRQLNAIGKVPADLVETITEHYGLSVLRTDALTLSIHGFERKFDRQMIAESLGAAGVQFFPTRQSATRSACESARELIYFGYGPTLDQCLTCPIAQLVSVITQQPSQLPQTTLLRDLREGFSTDESLFEIIAKDDSFHATIENPEQLESFQNNLRKTPLSVLAEEKCEDFFNRKVTVGPRDSIRWMLGSRHPWFDWDHAQDLIQAAFDNHGDNHFNTPQIVYYAYDPSIDELDIESMNANNHAVIDAFSDILEKEIRQNAPDLWSFIQPNIQQLSAFILDTHHDYPDFDLESEGRLGASTHIDFIGHSIHNKVSQELLGNDSETRRNLNMRAHFEASGMDKICLHDLSQENLDKFYAILEQMLQQYDATDGIQIHGETLSYKRIPCILFLIQNLGKPLPRENEKLLDSFDLSQVTELEHASHIRTYEAISEQLVVFFILTLRHMLETEHVPDLQPRNFTKDFLLLGLWGLRTPNIRINLYIDKSADEKDPAPTLSRTELRFIGTEQVETHPLSHIREDSKALRFAISRLAPQIEPAILRNIGTFVMAMEEFHSSSREFKPNGMTALHYVLDTAREVANWGLRGSVMDVMTVVEYTLDSSVKNVQYCMNFISKKLKSLQKDNK